MSTNGSISKTDTGYGKTGTYTTGAGNTGETYKNYDRTQTGSTVSSGLVTQGGKIVSKSSVMVHGDGAWSKDTTTTGVKGEIRTRNVGGT